VYCLGESGLVQMQDGNQISIDSTVSKKVFAMDEECLNPINDMSTFNDFHEASLLYNLMIRFQKDIIYTFVSNILISVNPFKSLSLYTPDQIDRYIENDCTTLSPHIFSIADEAFNSILKDVSSKPLIIYIHF